MKLSPCHFEFWSTRKAPAWAGLVLKPANKLLHSERKARERLLHICINAHAGGIPDYHASANLCAILRRKSGEELLTYLDKLAVYPGTVIDPARRSGYARKWARRIRERSPCIL